MQLLREKWRKSGPYLSRLPWSASNLHACGGKKRINREISTRVNCMCLIREAGALLVHVRLRSFHAFYPVLQVDHLKPPPVIDWAAQRGLVAAVWTQLPQAGTFGKWVVLPGWGWGEEIQSRAKTTWIEEKYTGPEKHKKNKNTTLTNKKKKLKGCSLREQWVTNLPNKITTFVNCKIK